MKKIEGKDRKNNNKIIAELITIPLCFLYLYYTFLYNHPKVSFIIVSIVLLITCIELIVKYIKEVYIYDNKYNILKIVFVVFNFLLIIFMFLNIFLKNDEVKYIFIGFQIVLLIYLLVTAVRNIIKIAKSDKNLYKLSVTSYFSSVVFYIILMGLIIYLK